MLLRGSQIAREHQLIVFADEIYDKTLYDGVTHTGHGLAGDDVLCITSTACRRTTAPAATAPAG